MLPPSVVNQPEIAQRHDYKCKGPVRIAGEQQGKHIQKFLPVWKISQVIQRDLFILQVKVNDKKSTCGGGT